MKYVSKAVENDCLVTNKYNFGKIEVIILDLASKPAYILTELIFNLAETFCAHKLIKISVTGHLGSTVSWDFNIPLKAALE